MLRMPESQSQLLNTQMSRPSSSKLPRYVETDKQIGRFYGYFHEVRPWDKDGPLGQPPALPLMPFPDAPSAFGPCCACV